MLVVGLDLTVLNLALPTMSVSLHASTSVAARAILGIGAAAVLPLALSVLPVLFAPQERQRAVAAIAGATMLSFPIGPIVGGYLLSHFWWGSVFLINVPVVVIAFAAVALLMPESRSERRPGIDLSGLAVSSLGLVALTYGFIKAGQDGWSDAMAVALIAAGVLMLGALPFVERRIAGPGEQPLADLRLFGSPGFRWGTILATLVSFAMFGILFALPQYFQDVRGADALGSGVRLLPLIGGMLLGMVAGTRLTSAGSGRPAPAGPRAVVTAGYLLMAAAMVLGALTTLASSTGYVLGWVAAVRSSVGAGVAAVGRAGSPELLGTVRSAFAHGMDLMLWTCGGIAVVCALLAVLFLPRSARSRGAGDATPDSVPGSLPVG